MAFFAGLIGFLFPGSGQVLNRKYWEGLMVFGSWMLWLFVSRYLLELELTLIVIGWLVFSAYSGFDAFLFDPRKIKQEDTQMKEFDELQEEKEKNREIELTKIRKLLERNLETEFTDFKILEMEKKEDEIKVKAEIEGRFVELIVSIDGEILSIK